MSSPLAALEKNYPTIHPRDKEFTCCSICVEKQQLSTTFNFLLVLIWLRNLQNVPLTNIGNSSILAIFHSKLMVKRNGIRQKNVDKFLCFPKDIRFYREPFLFLIKKLHMVFVLTPHTSKCSKYLLRAWKWI